MGIKTVPHPPYSPDLASCDFWLFPKFTGFRYETIDETKEAVTKVIDTLTQEDFHGAFHKLLKRYKCIAAGGDYFKGNLNFICVLSIKVPIRKSLKTYLMILVCCTWAELFKKYSISFIELMYIYFRIAKIENHPMLLISYCLYIYISIYIYCSTIWVAHQSKRFLCLFWRETRQRILGPEISPIWKW